jgi:hypothetical protein
LNPTTNYGYIVTHDGGSIAVAWPTTVGGELLPAKANASLIAAAPDLHQIGVEFDRLSLVIESAIRVASTVYLEDVVALIKANRAAIAKATEVTS